MILVTRLDRQVMLLNPDHIVTIEETPDTVVTLLNGHHFLIKERADIILGRIVAFRSKILRRAGRANSGIKYLARKHSKQFGGSVVARVRHEPDFSQLYSQDS